MDLPFVQVPPAFSGPVGQDTSHNDPGHQAVCCQGRSPVPVPAVLCPLFGDHQSLCTKGHGSVKRGIFIQIFKQDRQHVLFFRHIVLCPQGCHGPVNKPGDLLRNDRTVRTDRAVDPIHGRRYPVKVVVPETSQHYGFHFFPEAVILQSDHPGIRGDPQAAVPAVDGIPESYGFQNLVIFIQLCILQKDHVRLNSDFRLVQSCFKLFPTALF